LDCVIISFFTHLSGEEPILYYFNLFQIMTNKLTIAIPTYNRKDLLLKNVKNILTHSEECRVLIIDNATPKFEKIDLKQELGSLYTENIGRIKFIKNKINIGGNANVLRCIEYCETEYVWILGDDDFLLINFEVIVKPLLRQKHDWILFHQKDQFQPSRDKSRVVNSLESFLESLKSINELVFCSVNIYKTNSLKLGLEYSYENLNVMAPHLVAMIAGIEQNKSDKKSFLISKEEVLESVSNNKDTSTSWPLYKAFLGIYKLPRLEFGKT